MLSYPEQLEIYDDKEQKIYNGYPIEVKTLLSDNPLLASIKATHKLFKDFTNASKKKIAQSSEYIHLQNIYTFLVKHANRNEVYSDTVK